MTVPVPCQIGTPDWGIFDILCPASADRLHYLLTEAVFGA